MFVTLASSEVRAYEGARVLILGGQHGTPRLQVLTSELRTVGLIPLEVQARSGDSSPASLRALLEQHHAGAVIRLGSAGTSGLEVFIQRGALRLRREALPRRQAERWEITVVRLVELLRAYLLELPPAPDEPGMTPRSSAPPPSEPHRFSLRLAAGPTFSPGGVTVVGHLWLTPGVRALSWLEVELNLVFPLAPATIQGPEGTADLHIGLATAGVRFILARQSWRLRPSLGIGVGASLVHMRGEAVAPFTSGEDWVASFAGTVGAGLALRLPWRMSLGLDALVGVALPRPAVGLGSRVAATWGQPFVAINLGLGVRL